MQVKKLHRLTSKSQNERSDTSIYETLIQVKLSLNMVRLWENQENLFAPHRVVSRPHITVRAGSKSLGHLRWLKTVSSTYIWMGRYYHSLSLDATIVVSKNCPIIGEHVVIIFLTQ